MSGVPARSYKNLVRSCSVTGTFFVLGVSEMKSTDQNLKMISMKNTRIKGQCLLIVIIAFTFASCAKDEIIIDPDNLLIGNWNYSDYNDDALFFRGVLVSLMITVISFYLRVR